MDKTKLNIRDYITVGIIFVLQFVLYMIIATPIGSTVIGMFFVFPIVSIPWGILAVLLYSRVPKKNVVLLYNILFAVVELMNFWVIALVAAVFAVINELIWRHGEQKSFIKMMVAHIIFTLSCLISSFLPLILLKDMFLSAMPNYADFYTEVFQSITVPIAVLEIVLLIVCSVIGALLGRVLLKKHLVKAGITL